MTKFFMVYDDVKKQWFYLTDDEAKQRLGICELKAKMRTLEQSYEDLQSSLLSRVLIPEQKEAILKFLKKNHVRPIRTGMIRRSEYNIYDKAWNYALEELLEEEKIITVSHGRGRQRTWHLKEEK